MLRIRIRSDLDKKIQIKKNSHKQNFTNILQQIVVTTFFFFKKKIIRNVLLAGGGSEPISGGFEKSDPVEKVRNMCTVTRTYVKFSAN